MDSGMGHFYWNLVFTNSSNEPCSLDGIPSVVMAAASTGAPLGNAADPAAAPGAGSVPLAPGASAYSLLSFTAGGVYLCTAPVDALLVTAPNSDAVPAVVPAPNPIEGCDDTEHTLFTVGSLLAVPVTF
ncbi:hypothetical protein HNR05_003079 [Leifsonia psychrotolerans]|uniref:DUF4232 domain-containing protein n=2 Tax=Glaciibacter psychrotolerans TaxID=670054 RepID=A0A7Z0EGN1_9MICO|nr:hypothetical protein [Leifsonia psychrotolerans]